MTSRTLLLSVALAGGAVLNSASASELSPVEQLGKSIYFDMNLSINSNESCASCHAPQAGWANPLSGINAAGAVHPGSVRTLFGNRKPPSAAYATPSPVLQFDDAQALFIGGNFWDGRATGEKLGIPAADQAQAPFLNPVEQALPDDACVVYRVCTATTYPVEFEDVWDEAVCELEWPVDVDAECAAGNPIPLSDTERKLVDSAYDDIALSIAAYEASSEVNQYSSKFDAYLAGMARLTSKERQGLRLFTGKAKCANCHVLEPGAEGAPPLLTDYTFDNLGVPRNPENPWYLMEAFNPDGFEWVDQGLGGFLKTRDHYYWLAAENYGKQKVPTLRNVDLRPSPSFVKAYGHNGYFKSLKSIVHFYNTRDVKDTCPDPFTTEAEALAQDCWPEPEVAENLNTDELGDLGLNKAQEDAIVAFLKTLSDGYAP